jgi:hypothetical protein
MGLINRLISFHATRTAYKIKNIKGLHRQEGNMISVIIRIKGEEQTVR